MTSRETLSPGAIFKKLQAAFETQRPQECPRCRIPVPYAVSRKDEVSANWRIDPPKECPNRCDAVIGQLALDLASKYDMHDYAVHKAGD